MKPIRQAAHRPRDEGRVIVSEQQGFRVARVVAAGVPLLVEGVGRRGDPLAVPVETDVPHDSEEPRPAIAAAEGSKVAEGSERRFLHDIFGVVFIPHQPARQPAGRPEMGQHDLVEARTGRR